jgi:periplasmic divalent cation tolerance protein
MTTELRLLYVTSASRDEARLIARTVVEERLAACANILGDIESFYHWEGKFETGAEVLIVLKTHANIEKQLIERIKSLHSYTCPAIVCLPIVSGFDPFLVWVGAETAQSERAT